ncbi:hypothetical protein EYD46_11600 [Hyunsoonleella pacifica]|uniref:Uncharacterized protein n=1 Tax=Hyunsoonleella pacifica TaxID=1080224 RepID=A0A4Q9FR68_9FLAO|nr:hypothetical protein [Hyunsoonleella pacifica]TBN15759.1 hypothetical protein EYD46_11600 [Hyunsoonleella pacifica]
MNLSDLSDEEVKPIISDLEQRRLDGKLKRAFPDWYFPQRKEAERNLLKSFIEKGGKPERNSPHYFCLGKSKGIELGYNNDFKTVELPIELVEKDVLFSIGDTLFTFSKSHTEKIKWKNEWYQGKLYNYEETVEIIKELKLDLNNTESLNQNKIACIEGLIWSDKILKEVLEKTNYNNL